MTGERRPRSFAPVVNEILMAAGPVPVNPGPMAYGNDVGFAAMVKALYEETDGGRTRADQVLLGAYQAVGQVDPDALRTALIVLAGRATAWIYDIDAGFPGKAA